MSRKRRFSSVKYKAWRLSVYKRDNFKCRWPRCKSNHGLNAHHITRWVDSVALRFNTSNGITLCCKHHKMVTGKESYYAVFLSGLLRKYKGK